MPEPQATQLPVALPTHPKRFLPGGQAPHDSHTPGKVPPHPFRTRPDAHSSQFVQAEAPAAAEYFSASHSWHVVAPTVGEYFPASQLVHGSPPGLALYLPVSHAVHGPPLLTVYLETHEQAPMEVLPSAETELSGQLVQPPSPDVSL